MRFEFLGRAMVPPVLGVEILAWATSPASAEQRPPSRVGTAALTVVRCRASIYHLVMGFDDVARSMKQRHGGKLQDVGAGSGQISADKLVTESRRLERRSSIRNDFLLAAMMLAGSVLVFVLVFNTAKSAAHQPRSGVAYVMFYSPLGLALRHLVRGFRRLFSRY